MTNNINIINNPSFPNPNNNGVEFYNKPVNNKDNFIKLFNDSTKQQKRGTKHYGIINLHKLDDNKWCVESIKYFANGSQTMEYIIDTPTQPNSELKVINAITFESLILQRNQILQEYNIS